MLPYSTRNGGALVSAHKVIAITMLDTYSRDALQTNLTQSINEAVVALERKKESDFLEKMATLQETIAELKKKL